MTQHHPLERMLRHVEMRGKLDASDREALLGLPHEVRTLERASYIVREGEPPTRSCLLLSGFAFRHKLTMDGARQITSVHMPGDFVDLQGTLLNVADHNVQSLTRCDVAFIPRAALREMIDTRPRLARALWIDTLIDGAIYMEWVVNVGRRDARSRIAHLLCEFARRLEAVGLAEEYRYELPMTQEQLGDATGLTAVHVNRTLRDLDREKLVERKNRFVSIPNWEALRQVGDFTETYLHLDQVPREADRAAGRLH